MLVSSKYFRGGLLLALALQPLFRGLWPLALVAVAVALVVSVDSFGKGGHDIAEAHLFLASYGS